MSEIIVAVLLLASGLLALTAGIGLVRPADYFLRMHAPALAYTLGSWSVTLASVIHFSSRDGTLSLHVWLVIIVLSVTAPVTTVLLARAALFRGRKQGQPLPPPVMGTGP
ncbi:MAG: Na+/H+ antiporter subunit [Ramlibacter sp.]|jgi:multicomponent K+:H+ antiporter subunit G|uniref:monovalent cation/H(+) antiporter subunit G n=1 Tax=Ramlibacter sp. TaxID=1917967 RepID=UPI0026289381|nr:monovalent cation/H(+) antiporter subunit G [Ramlibacter sp.]MDB5751429.1 Na+/H+ antiporter subunit [Ramlibacter sp.]